MHYLKMIFVILPYFITLPAYTSDLHDAVKAGDIEAVNTLIEEEVDVNERDDNGNAPLHYIHQYEGRVMIEIVHPDGRLSSGDSNIPYISPNTRIVIMETLIEAGSDINAKDFDGMALLHRLISMRYREPGEIHNDTLVTLALIAKGADVNVQDSDNATPLHYTSKSQHYYGYEYERTNTALIATALIAEGADIHARDTDGNTPLHYAGNFTRTDIARLLVAAGADVNARDNDGNIPLHYSITMRGNKKDNISTFLIRVGSDINAENNYSEIPSRPSSDNFQFRERWRLKVMNDHSKLSGGSMRIYRRQGE